ncbi:GYD domain-containing protein [Nitratireductor aquimarinus]|uniref:GYD domain-containing protein n=1 Tax=Nitratireductor aquimarinus TaxID=889300 RepID=A0ABU4AG63_9HYPH|nr:MULTISPECIES: GYD domain-containing protein [Alphaproteobacteria]MBY6022297.1 GYD domain-containing protein [Nitratireductor sp. DP7N14-4]MBN7757507.1 GYD domain-containing protein [Nitratireductor aquimarinus]MBN7762933.1 GYD domain-containing protein [Nitratireductor aquibiodomus]MBN7774898.1 GYD domain-containing protein [Nitratireductor pacificus]MBN7779759.1 GYD domain-containing protein [Nitratireductor pacificus]
MTTYIILINWTDQGIKNVKDSPNRLESAKAALSKMGGTLRAFYLTMGEYDMVAVSEAPDDEVAARFALTLGMGGNVRTKVVKAFPEAAYRDIIGSLG